MEAVLAHPEHRLRAQIAVDVGRSLADVHMSVVLRDGNPGVDGVDRSLERRKVAFASAFFGHVLNRWDGSTPSRNLGDGEVGANPNGTTRRALDGLHEGGSVFLVGDPDPAKNALDVVADDIHGHIEGTRVDN